MLRAALVLFALGLLAVFLGANNVAGISIGLGKTLLFIFLALSILSFIVSLASGRDVGGLPGQKL